MDDSGSKLLISEASSLITIFRHVTNIQILATEMYRFANGIPPEAMDEVFQLREEYCNQRFTSRYAIPLIRSDCNCSESVSFLGLEI